MSEILICVTGGDTDKATIVAEALSRTSELDCSIVVVDPRTESDRFLDEIVKNFQLRNLMPLLDTNLFTKNQNEGRRFDGTLKRR